MKRDWAIVGSYKREIDMREKTVRSKKRYTRKIKHKNRMFEGH